MKPQYSPDISSLNNNLGTCMGWMATQLSKSTLVAPIGLVNINLLQNKIKTSVHVLYVCVHVCCVCACVPGLLSQNLL